jgi:hypothetical protein
LFELRDQLFLFLMKNAGKKFTVAEIAKSFRIDKSVGSFCPQYNLRSLLDHMAVFALIESVPCNEHTCYFINK